MQDLFKFLFIYFYKFIYFILFLTALGLRCCARAFSSCSKRGPLLAAVRGLLTAGAPPCFRAQVLGAQASAAVVRTLSSCGARAQLLCDM